MKGKRFPPEKKKGGGRGGTSPGGKEERDRDRILWVYRAQKSFALLASRTTEISSKATERKELCAVERQTGPQAALQKILKAQVNFWTNKS